MAGVDSLLRMMLRHGADELRIGTDLPPKMLQRGAPVRLSIPPTDDETLRHLLGELWTPEREAQLRGEGRSAFGYQMDGGEAFSVALQRRGEGEPLQIDASFKKEAAPAKAKVAPPVVSSAFVAPPPGVTVSPPVTASASSGPLSPGSVALLERAVALHASDLHLYWGEPPTVRIDGRLRRMDEAPHGAAEQLLQDCAADEAARAASPAGRSADLALELEGVGRFRVNLYQAGGRAAAAIRVLPGRAPRLAELHFPVGLAEVVQAPHGLVLVCGPTGSGKSATLAALAEEALRQRGGLLITLEDPIEYPLAGEGSSLVRQRQIGRDARDFATGLRDALREDPDILLIGEMRDPESISLALTAAETGHLVLASLHSRSAAATVERIVDSYAPERQQQVRVQLADALRAVVAQRLLPRKGGGRLPAVEILRGNHGVAALIREGKTAQLPNVIQSSRKEGMLPLERCLAEMVRSGQVEKEAALYAANDPATLASLLG